MQQHRRARDNARLAAVEWGTWGPRGTAAGGVGAQPRLSDAAFVS